MWTLRVRANGETAQLHEVDPDAPFKRLQKRVADMVKIAVEEQRILAGFPPRPIVGSPSRDEEEATKGTEEEEKDEEEEEVGGGEEKMAGAASGAPAQQQQQDQQQPDEGPSVRAMGVVNCDTLIVSLRTDIPHQSVAPPKKKTTKGTKRKAGSGAAAGTSTSTTSTSSSTSVSWEEAAANGLIKAASGSASELEAELVPMRKALKEHLKQREEERLANHRLSAMLAGAFEMEASLGGRLSDSMPSLKVSFAVGARKVLTEDVLMMGKPLLRAIVQNIVADPDARENLRLFNMAFFSPRVFWNLVYHYHDGEDPAFDLQDKVIALAPDADWAFLAARKRNLSEKALTNKFLEEEVKRKREIAAAQRAARAAKKAKLQEGGGQGEGEGVGEGQGEGEGEGEKAGEGEGEQEQGEGEKEKEQGEQEQEQEGEQTVEAPEPAPEAESAPAPREMDTTADA